jgi:hypothetical protein
MMLTKENAESAVDNVFDDFMRSGDSFNFERCPRLMLPVFSADRYGIEFIEYSIARAKYQGGPILDVVVGRINGCGPRIIYGREQRERLTRDLGPLD